MLRFLKWIFFVFGGLGILIMSFFFIQNKHDLKMYFSSKDSYSYETIKLSCSDVKDEYYYPCFEAVFKKYLEKVSLTGTSLGLKSAFNFIEIDRENQKAFEYENEVKIRYALNHLRLNNLALNNSVKRFFGLEFTYGGYVGKIKDFNTEAVEFSDGIIEGLNGDDGIDSTQDPELKEAFKKEFMGVAAEYEAAKNNVQKWLDAEIVRLKKLHDA